MGCAPYYNKIVDTINERIASFPEKYGYPEKSQVTGLCVVDKTNRVATVRILNIVGYKSKIIDEIIVLSYRYNVYFISKSEYMPASQNKNIIDISNSFMIQFPIDPDRKWKPRYYPSPSKNEIDKWKNKIAKTIFDFVGNKPSVNSQFGKKIKLQIAMNQNEDMVCYNINIHIKVYSKDNKIFYCIFSPRGNTPYFDASAEYYISSFTTDGFPSKYGVPFQDYYKDVYIVQN